MEIGGELEVVFDGIVEAPTEVIGPWAFPWEEQIPVSAEIEIYIGSPYADTVISNFRPPEVEETLGSLADLVTETKEEFVHTPIARAPFVPTVREPLYMSVMLMLALLAFPVGAGLALVSAGEMRFGISLMLIALLPLFGLGVWAEINARRRSIRSR